MGARQRTVSLGARTIGPTMPRPLLFRFSHLLLQCLLEDIADQEVDKSEPGSLRNMHEEEVFRRQYPGPRMYFQDLVILHPFLCFQSCEIFR